mgnify:CR=1 FL=1
MADGIRPLGGPGNAKICEYLRILEKGYKIRAVQVESDAVSVDTKEDLAKVSKEMN